MSFRINNIPDPVNDMSFRINNTPDMVNNMSFRINNTSHCFYNTTHYINNTLNCINKTPACTYNSSLSNLKPAHCQLLTAHRSTPSYIKHLKSHILNLTSSPVPHPTPLSPPYNPPAAKYFSAANPSSSTGLLYKPAPPVSAKKNH